MVNQAHSAGNGPLGTYLEPAYIFDVAGSEYPPAVAAVGDGDLQTFNPGGPVKPGTGVTTGPAGVPGAPPRAQLDGHRQAAPLAGGAGHGDRAVGV